MINSIKYKQLNDFISATLRANAPEKRNQLFAKIASKEITSIEQIDQEITSIREGFFLLIYNVNSDIPNINDADYIRSVINELTFFYQSEFNASFVEANKDKVKKPFKFKKSGTILLDGEIELKDGESFEWEVKE